MKPAQLFSRHIFSALKYFNAVSFLGSLWARAYMINGPKQASCHRKGIHLYIQFLLFKKIGKKSESLFVVFNVRKNASFQINACAFFSPCISFIYKYGVATLCKQCSRHWGGSVNRRTGQKSLPLWSWQSISGVIINFLTLSGEPSALLKADSVYSLFLSQMLAHVACTIKGANKYLKFYFSAQ